MKYTNQIFLSLITNIKRVFRFLYALFWHIISGFPTANNQQILERYSICIICENFNHEKSICNICGCNLSKRKEFMNKLAWADSECPIDKWSSIDINNSQ